MSAGNASSSLQFLSYDPQRVPKYGQIIKVHFPHDVCAVSCDSVGFEEGVFNRTVDAPPPPPKKCFFLETVHFLSGRGGGPPKTIRPKRGVTQKNTYSKGGHPKKYNQKGGRGVTFIPRNFEGSFLLICLHK